MKLNSKVEGGHQESHLDDNAPPPQCNARNGEDTIINFSRKWDWFFGVEEGGSDQEESLHDNQGSQRDSMGGCVDQLDFKGGGGDQKSQGNGKGHGGKGGGGDQDTIDDGDGTMGMGHFVGDNGNGMMGDDDGNNGDGVMCNKGGGLKDGGFNLEGAVGVNLNF